MAVASGGRVVGGSGEWRVASKGRTVASGGRTVASGQWSVASECEAGEIGVMEKRQNEANLPVVLIICIL